MSLTLRPSVLHVCSCCILQARQSPFGPKQGQGAHPSTILRPRLLNARPESRLSCIHAPHAGKCSEDEKEFVLRKRLSYEGVMETGLSACDVDTCVDTRNAATHLGKVAALSTGNLFAIYRPFMSASSSSSTTWRVDHRRGEVRVSEGLLHHADIRGLSVELGGKSMTERMRGHALHFLNPSLPSVPLNRPSQVRGGHLRTFPGRE
jgi:hypothetical protein